MPEATIGQLAVELGYVTPEALSDCVRIQDNERSARGLGRILLERGLISELQLSFLLSARARDVRGLEQYVRAKADDLVLKDALRAVDRVSEDELRQCLREQAEHERLGRTRRLAVLLREHGLADDAGMTAALDAIGEERRLCAACGAFVAPGADSLRRTGRCPDCDRALPAPVQLPDPEAEPVTRVRVEAAATRVRRGHEATIADAPASGAATTPASRPATPASTHAGHPDGTPFGRYVILEEIARGGMGIVYKAHHPGINRIIALKVLHTDGTPTEQDIKRFQREATAAARLQHPNIVSVMDVGIESGLPYLTMEFIDGPSLATVITRQRLPVRRALEILRDVALGVDFAHKQGIIHRDLKPGNILIDGAGLPRLTDFGLAKQLDSASQLTRTGTALGTPSYMAPEQAEADTARTDHRADVYGLGAVMYHLLTGCPPFKGDTTVQTLYKVISQEAPRPSRVVPGIPGEVETICLKAMDKSISRRYQSAAELAADLDRWLKGEPILAQRPSLMRRTVRTFRRHRTLASTFGVLLFLLAWTLFDRWERGAAAARQQEDMAREMQRVAEAQRRKFEREKQRIEEQMHSTLAGSGAGGVGGATVPPGREPTTPAELLQRGLAFQTDRHLAAAIQDFDSALAMQPADGALAAALLTARALAHSADGRPEAAIRDFDTLLTRADAVGAPRLQALHYRGLLRLERDEFTGADEDLSEVLATSPDLLSARLHRGIARVQQGRYDDALVDLDHALTLAHADPADRARVLIFRALAHHGRQDYARAVEDNSRALELDPASAQALTNRGIAWLCGSDLDRAIADLDRALALAPGDPFATPARELAARLQAAGGGRR